MIFCWFELCGQLEELLSVEEPDDVVVVDDSEVGVELVVLLPRGGVDVLLTRKLEFVELVVELVELIVMALEVLSDEVPF